MRTELHIIPLLCNIQGFFLWRSPISHTKTCGKWHERINCCLYDSHSMLSFDVNYKISSECSAGVGCTFCLCKLSLIHLCQPFTIFSLHHSLMRGISLTRQRNNKKKKQGHTQASTMRKHQRWNHNHHPPAVKICGLSVHSLHTSLSWCSGLVAANESNWLLRC